MCRIYLGKSIYKTATMPVKLSRIIISFNYTNPVLHLSTMSTFRVVKAKTCALPQYSQAVVFGDTVYCSGDIGAVPGTNWELAKGTVKDRAVCFLPCFLRKAIYSLMVSL